MDFHHRPGSRGARRAFLSTCLGYLGARLPSIRFHDLRHTVASILLNQGIPVTTVSRRLGHAKPSITLDVYGHLIPSMQEKAAYKIDELITPVAFQQLHPICNITRPSTKRTPIYEFVKLKTPKSRG